MRDVNLDWPNAKCSNIRLSFKLIKMNNLEFGFTIFFGYIVVAFLFVVLWKRLLKKGKND